MSHESSRRPGSNGTHAQAAELTPPDPQVIPKAERRRFSAEYKQRILAEADACTERGQIGALLRREGLYSSHLDKWRKQRQRGVLQALTPQKRGPKPDPQAAEIAQLRRENEQLRTRLQRAEHIIEVQKKLAELLGTLPPESPSSAEVSSPTLKR
jgi:transposase